MSDKFTKCIVVGPPGAGKTSLAATLPENTVYLISMEAGLLSIQGNDDAGNPLFQGTVKELRDWAQFRSLCLWIAGPDPSVPADHPLSKAKYDALLKHTGGTFAERNPDIRTIFVDSLTEASRLVKRYAEQQPDALTKDGKTDGFAVFGTVADEMIGLLSHLRHAPFNIVMSAILENETDSLGDTHHRIQLVGKATGKQITGLVDEVFVMDTFKAPDGTPYRALITSKPNKYDFEAKDRSGTLNKIEGPDLGAIFAKIQAGKRARPLQRTLPAGIGE